MLRLSAPGHSRLEEADLLDVRIGGSESNTAVAVARLGMRVAWWSKLPANPMGRRVELTDDLISCDVDVSWWVGPDAYDAGYYTKLYRALRIWVVTDYPFFRPHYSNSELPDIDR